ncbi:MAG: DMT family transporter [Limnochordia bacterium]|jgi:drug/metabolite transporter (DMT)-like permease
MSTRQFLRLMFATTVWGANTVLIKALFSHFPPLELQAFRMAMAALILIPVAARHRRRKIVPEARRLALRAAFCAVFLHQVCLARGMPLAKAGLSSLILSLNPLATAVIAHFVLDEPLTRRRLTGVLIGFGGVVAAVANEWHLMGTKIGVAELLIFGAMLTYVMGGIFVKKARDLIPPLQLTAMIQIYGALMLLLPATMNVMRHGIPQKLPGPIFWIAAIASATIATGYCNYLWNRSIQEIGASTTSMFANVMPFVSLITASIFLHESITALQIVGLGAVILGIFLGATPGLGKQQTRADLTHSE